MFMDQMNNLMTPDQTVMFLRQYLESLALIQCQSQNQTHSMVPFTCVNSEQIKQNWSKYKTKSLHIDKLSLDEKNEGILKAYILLPPLKFMSIMFPIMDENGDCILFAIYNFISELPISQQFQVGYQIQIANPYLKIGQDGNMLIRVDNPKEFIFLQPNLDGYFQTLQHFVNQIYTIDKQFSFDFINIIKKNNCFASNPLTNQWIKNINDQLRSIPEDKSYKFQDPLWKDHHYQVDKILNTPIEKLMDKNQEKELMEMVGEQEIFTLFHQANSLSLQNPQRSLNIFENLIKKTSKYAVIYYNYGELSFSVGKHENCLNAMLKFLEIHEKKKFVQSRIYNFAHYHIGFSLKKLQDAQQSEKYLIKACTLDPTNLTFQYALGDFYYSNNQNKRAQKILEKLVIEFAKQKRDLDDAVELQRALYVLFKIAQQECDFEKMVQNADSLADMEEENFIYIYNDIAHYFIDKLSDEQKLQLLKKLEKSRNFDIIYDELHLLYLLVLKDAKEKQKQLSIYIQNNGQDEQKLELQDIAQQENVDQTILELMKPEKDEINFDKSYIIEEIKDKKRKVCDSEKSRLIQSENKVKFSAYFASFEMISQKYIITVNPEINFNPSVLRQKFRQAAYKGFAHSKCGASGIIIIKLKNKIIYELKIINSDKRLICFEREKIGKNSFKLHFDRLLGQKEAKRLRD